MPQYLIPQKTQREDKIVGPLTGKQLLYAMITIVGNFIVFSSINSNPFIEFALIEKMLIIAPFAFLGLAFTFLQVNERPFEIWFASFLTYLQTPKVRVWQKEIQELDTAVATSTVKVAKDEAAEVEIDIVTRQKIEQLSQMVDKPDTMIPEQKIPDNSPTSRTLELLKTVESGLGQEKTSSMQIIAKPHKGLSGLIHTISATPQKMFSSLFQDSRATKKGAAIPKNKVIVDAQPDIPIMMPGESGPDGQRTSAPLDINALLSHHAPTTPVQPPPTDPLSTDKPL